MLIYFRAKGIAEEGSFSRRKKETPTRFVTRVVGDVEAWPSYDLTPDNCPPTARSTPDPVLSLSLSRFYLKIGLKSGVTLSQSERYRYAIVICHCFSTGRCPTFRLKSGLHALELLFHNNRDKIFEEHMLLLLKMGVETRLSRVAKKRARLDWIARPLSRPTTLDPHLVSNTRNKWVRYKLK